MPSTSLDDLAEPLRSAVKGLVAEAARNGVTVTGGTLRTYADQAALRIKNGCPDIHTSPASSCRVPTARPGESKHETGQAIDFTNTDTIIREVERLAGKYRIHRTVPGERWHYEHVDGSTAAGDAGTPTPGDPDTGGGGSSITSALRLLASGELWLRVLHVIAGAVLVVVGLGLIGVDLGAAGALGKVAP